MHKLVTEKKQKELERKEKELQKKEKQNREQQKKLEVCHMELSELRRAHIEEDQAYANNSGMSSKDIVMEASLLVCCTF